MESQTIFESNKSWYVCNTDWKYAQYLRILCCNCIFRFGYITNWILILLVRMSVTISTHHDNPAQIRSSSGSATEKMDFLICNKCIWFASLYTNRNIHPNIKCPICNDNSNLESMPISHESNIIDLILWYERNLVEI